MRYGPVTDLADRLRLMVIADRGTHPDRVLAEKVEEALVAGAPSVQLRDKGRCSRETLALARRLAELAHAHGALFLVNDRADIALAAGADGVHLGLDDLPVAAARRAFGSLRVIGASASTPREATAAARAGADYVGCGSIFPTGSKPDAGEPIGTSGLAAVVRSVSIPVLGIGGITPQGAAAIAGTGAAGIAVISAVMDAPSVQEATVALLAAWPARSVSGEEVDQPEPDPGGGP